MAEIQFNILNYLAGMAGALLDKDALVNVAFDCGVSTVTDYSELTQETIDRCEMAILKKILKLPYTTASHTSKHGEWQEQNGSQVITEKNREDYKARLKKLAEKYEDEELLEELEGMDANLQWLP